MAAIVPGPDSSNQMVHEVQKLEDLVRIAREIRPLGDECRVGGNGSVAHAEIVRIMNAQA